MKKVSVALIGYGHLGKWHAEKAKLSNHANLVAIVDPGEKSQELAKEKFPDVKICSSIDDVIQDIDAALVVTPTSFHHKIVLKLLENNVHVFCEKPLTESLEQSLEIKNVLESKKQLLLQVGHSERVHEVWEKSLENTQFFNEDKAIAHFKRVAPYKGRATDVDVIQDLMIHDIDLAFYLFKQEAKVVRAFGEKIRTDKFDYVWAEVIFKGGFRATFIASRNDVLEQRTLEVINKHGTYMVDLFKNEYKMAKANEENSESYVVSHNYDKRDHLAYEQERFYGSILRGEDNFVGVNDAVKVARVMDAIKESILTHQEIILS